MTDIFSWGWYMYQGWHFDQNWDFVDSNGQHFERGAHMAINDPRAKKQQLISSYKTAHAWGFFTCLSLGNLFDYATQSLHYEYVQSKH